jgi:hypothetical protein
MSQHDIVLEHLKEHGSISSMEAFTKYYITRLSAVIFDLRADGYEIETNMVHKKRKSGEQVHYAVYKLV